MQLGRKLDCYDGGEVAVVSGLVQVCIVDVAIKLAWRVDFGYCLASKLAFDIAEPVSAVLVVIAHGEIFSVDECRKHIVQSISKFFYCWR